MEHQEGFGFRHLSHDQQLAIFACAPSSGYQALRYLLEDCTTKAMISKLNHVIVLRGRVSDVYLPVLTVDWPAKTMGFNWKASFSILFAEEKLYKALRVHTVSGVPTQGSLA